MIEVIQNNSVTFDITPYLTDRGWVILSPNSMKHTPPNEGEFEVNYVNVQPSRTYEYSFQVSGMASGSLVFTMGGSSVSAISTNGYFQGEITTVDNSPIKVWADGDVTISNINITEKITSEDRDGKMDTITWSENRKGWVTFKDLLPESGFSMFTKMFTLKDGNLWEHKIQGTTPNNFYGVQYSAKVKFPVSSVGVKTYHTIALHSNKILGTTENGITTQLGNVADLITYDFTSREGVHYANKLRDAVMDDKLKGRYIVIELTDEETKDQYLQIFKIVVKSEMSTLSE